MFKGLVNEWKKARGGLLLPGSAKFEAMQLLRLMISDGKDKSDAPFWVRSMMQNHALYDDGFRKQYYPLLETALNHETRFAQAIGMRALAMELIETVLIAIFALYEDDDPWKERSEADRLALEKSSGRNWTLQQFVDNEMGNLIVFEPSKIITLALAEEHFGDKPHNYADAYQLAFRRITQLKFERIVCEANGSYFEKQDSLDWYEVCVPALREQIMGGRNIPLEQIRELDL